MNSRTIRAVDMVRQIRDRHARLLTGKTPDEVIAFYRAAGDAAMQDARERAKPRRRKVS
jgi:hypothetical protein